MKKFITSAIVLFSESIWIYFFFALFISVEWKEPIFINAVWWIVAGLLGYIVNLFIAGKMNVTFVMGGNVLVVMLIIIANWNQAIPEGAWLTGTFFSLAICYVYGRSASFIYKEATRMHVLQRFELTIIIYLFLMFVFTFNDWLNDYFHLSFLGAIFSTLFAMILTLDTDEKTNENEHVDIQKVGHSGRFIGVISLLFSTVVIISALFFLPAVRDKLQQFTLFGMDAIIKTFQQIGNFFAWIFSFFDMPTTEGDLPDAVPQAGVDIGEAEEEVLFSFPVGWMIAGICVVVIIVLLFVFGHFLKSWQPPPRNVQKRMKKSAIRINWNALREKIRMMMSRLRLMFRSRFARFYKHEVYWYFKKIEQWGKKRGISRNPSETSGDYVDKIIHILEQTDVSEGHKFELIDELHKMNRNYEAAYYGSKGGNGNYEELLNALKKIPRQRN